MNQEPRPIALLVNANSRKGREMFDAAQKALRDAGLEIEAHAVHSIDETRALLKREIDAGAKFVIVGGGDGTLSEVAGQLVHTQTAMGVLPLGTGNTFARSIGIPLNLEEACKTIAGGWIEGIDVGRVNNQYFLNSVALGLSAEIAGALDKNTKKKLGLMAWPVVGFRVLAGHRPLILRVVSQEKTYSVRTHQLLVVNGRYVAGPIAASPQASVQDHSFDVFVLGGAKRGSLYKTAWNWLRGRHMSD
ncbi:MAG TPA: YegS/Rv2252/BmrU family lipid kinase, partial [Abditibacteriaceae bacterium]|nr:YegS/Rv2252/BmrU family lipid kinase [Abditibacteriaceae bacterium]